MNYRGVLSRAVRNLLRGHRSRIIQRCEYSAGSDGIMRSPHGMQELPTRVFHELLYEKFEKYGTKTAVECSLTGKKYSYAELRKFSGILAAAMQNKLKLGKGDVIALFLPNLPEYPMIFLAGSECGVISTTVNSNYTQEELARQLQASDAKAVFTTTEKYDIVETALKKIQRKLPVIVIKEKEDSTVPSGAANFAEFLDPSTCGQLRSSDTTKDDILVLPFSSGTTGLPKGVELMHKNITANVMQISDRKFRITGLDSTEDISLAILPMFHIYGMSCITFTTLYGGGHLVSMSNFEPNHFVETIANKKLKSLYLVPPLLLFLSSAPTVTPEILKHVVHIVSGAAPLGHKDLEKLLLKGKHILIGQGYGMTETSPVVLLHTRESIHKYGGCGAPVISTEVKIVDTDTMKTLGANQPGELWVRGPQVMKGYYKNPKATEEIFVDGWLRTGDIAHYDEEGDFFISDRIKDLIKVKGFQVAPAELEELLRTNPKIADAAVIGIPHPAKGEVPKAFIVLKKGETAKEEEIMEFVKGKVAKYKELDGGVTFLDAIPKNSAGKILKKELL